MSDRRGAIKKKKKKALDKHIIVLLTLSVDLIDVSNYND